MVVNLHVTERCNFRCVYCFGQWGLRAAEAAESSVFANSSRAQEIMYDVSETLLAYDGIRFNFVGGEPALLGNISDLVTFARGLGARTSYVSNGLMLRRFEPSWTLAKIDLVGISIDSVAASTNMQIGRAGRNGRPFNAREVEASIEAFRSRAQDRVPLVKINTVVSSWNIREDFSSVIRAIRPDRWKLLKMLPVYSQAGVVSDDEFEEFVARHADLGPHVVPEDNDQMTGSYVMIDPLSRFFWYPDEPGAGYKYSSPIVDVGAPAAWAEVTLDREKFDRRYA